MRNWNTGISIRARLPTQLPDYLWGIETSTIETAESNNTGFQTTYEELKLKSCHSPSVSSNQLPDYLWGIETFHAGWNVPGLYLASRLPMRNWNSDARVLSQCPFFKLPDYLWGIETRGDAAHALADKMLPDYLWGIETKMFPNWMRKE